MMYMKWHCAHKGAITATRPAEVHLGLPATTAAFHLSQFLGNLKYFWADNQVLK